VAAVDEGLATYDALRDPHPVQASETNMFQRLSVFWLILIR
jgi:hypothetical protein